MVTSILIIVPTRGRPANAQRLAAQLAATLSNSGDTEVDLLFAVDEDDPELNGYLDLQAFGEWVEAGPRLRMAGTLNMHAIEQAGLYDIIGFLGDDHFPQTKGWDQIIAQEMTNGGILYGNDLIQGPNLPTAVFMDSQIIRKLGYMVPPGFIHLFLDNTWKTWGEEAGTLKYLPDVIIEHLHPLVGKADSDDQYVEVNSNEVWTADEKRFKEYSDNGELQADVDRIKKIAYA